MKVFIFFFLIKQRYKCVSFDAHCSRGVGKYKQNSRNSLEQTAGRRKEHQIDLSQVDERSSSAHLRKRND